AIGDVAADSSIAAKAPFRVENRFTADACDLEISVPVDALPLPVPKRLVRFEQRAVSRPVGFVRALSRQLPSGLAEERLHLRAETAVQVVGEHREPESFVLLPIP